MIYRIVVLLLPLAVYSRISSSSVKISTKSVFVYNEGHGILGSLGSPGMSDVILIATKWKD
jgi:hypothetical protein